MEHGAPESSTNLAEKSALVTGASRGIGFAIARTLAGSGATVTCVARDAQRLEQAVSSIVAEGGKAHAEPGDVTDPAFLEGLVSRTPSLDVLVNNAGMNIVEPFIEVSFEHINQIISLNVISVAYLSRLVAQQMVEENVRGVIISTSSAQGHVGAAGRAIYSASKHAVEGLTKSMAAELGPVGIRAVTVAPTFAYTEMTAPRLDDQDFRASVEATIPLRRVTQPQDVANAVAWLASPAASFVTGSSLLVDGGFTAQ